MYLGSKIKIIIKIIIYNLTIQNKSFIHFPRYYYYHQQGYTSYKKNIYVCYACFVYISQLVHDYLYVNKVYVLHQAYISTHRILFVLNYIFNLPTDPAWRQNTAMGTKGLATPLAHIFTVVFAVKY